jgi:uncharacterized damage-inducible protein DinB
MLRELLKDTFAYIQPTAALSDLSDGDAGQRLTGAPHSIVEIVAHLAFWQDWFLARCRGEALPMVGAAGEGWPASGASDWSAVRSRFEAGIEAATALSEDDTRIARPVVPAIEFPPLAAYTIREALTHVALHNAHHLGQVVTLRQLMGKWPPPSGSWTW